MGRNKGYDRIRKALPAVSVMQSAPETLRQLASLSVDDDCARAVADQLLATWPVPFDYIEAKALGSILVQLLVAVEDYHHDSDVSLNLARAMASPDACNLLFTGVLEELAKAGFDPEPSLEEHFQAQIDIPHEPTREMRFWRHLAGAAGRYHALLCVQAKWGEGEP